MDAEAASFNTVTFATSLGLIILASPSTPSIKTKAFPPCPMDVLPLMLKAGDCVGLPSPIVRFKFGTKPCNP